MTGHDYRWMRLFTISVFPYMTLAGIFWGLLGGMIPPFPANTPPQVLAEYVQEHNLRLRIGFGVAVPLWGLLTLWCVALFGMMRRMTGPNALLPYVQLIGGSLTILIPTIATVFWLAAAMRPDRDPALIQMLYDLGWLTVDMTFMVTTLQYLAAGIVFLQDKRTVPLVPKWLAWLAIWFALEFFLELLMPHFATGPFSWVGLFNYWVAFFGPAIWMGVVSLYMLRAFTRLEDEDRSTLR